MVMPKYNDDIDALVLTEEKFKTFEQDVVVFCCKTPCPLLDAQAPFKPFRFGRHGYSDEVPHFEIERRNLGYLRWS